MNNTILVLITKALGNEDGATAIEYALIASLISIAIIGALLALNGSMVDMYEYIRSFLVPVLSGS